MEEPLLGTGAMAGMGATAAMAGTAAMGVMGGPTELRLRGRLAMEVVSVTINAVNIPFAQPPTLSLTCKLS